MSAFDARCGAQRQHVARWVAAIAKRRCDERPQALHLVAQDVPPEGHRAFWTGLLADHDLWTQFQLAAMLDGHDAIVRPSDRAGPDDTRVRDQVVSMSAGGRRPLP
ncbi:hypothetical protein GCM10023322_32370 [Rugosimonospora acidiphila]|uniref:Uncharacterized protein n=1 Tax=Rugosimonospora acidiphila TaxID=556531 RepID=A0ABP9RSJ9_9ACTN